MTDKPSCGWLKHVWTPWHYLHGNIRFRTCQNCGKVQSKT